MIASEVANGLSLPRLPVLLARERLDPRRLQASTLLGVLWDPEGAREAGFLDRLAPRGALEAGARAEAERLAALPPGTYEGSIASARGDALAALRASLPG